MSGVLVQSSPLHGMGDGQVREVGVSGPAACRGWHTVQSANVARDELRLALPQSILKHLARLLHRGAEHRRSGDAQETEFSQRTDGDASPCFPIEHAVMVLVLFPQPREEHGDVQELSHGNSSIARRVSA